MNYMKRYFGVPLLVWLELTCICIYSVGLFFCAKKDIAAYAVIVLISSVVYRTVVTATTAVEPGESFPREVRLALSRFVRPMTPKDWGISALWGLAGLVILIVPTFLPHDVFVDRMRLIALACWGMVVALTSWLGLRREQAEEKEKQEGSGAE